MELKEEIINSVETWESYAPPMGKDKQWKDGRSAKELARYITNNPNKVPKEIEEAILSINPKVSKLNWKAEYVTPFPQETFGCGGGRNHDMIMFSNDLFIGIEAKADESFDEPLSKWLHLGKGKNSEANRRKRADAMCNLIFGNNSSEYENLRYQLLSAMTGILLEAEKRNIDTAVLMILTFKKKGFDNKGKPFFSEEKIKNNKKDLEDFLKATNYNPNNGKIEINSNIHNVYVKHITIEVD